MKLEDVQKNYVCYTIKARAFGLLKTDVEQTNAVASSIQEQPLVARVQISRLGSAVPYHRKLVAIQARARNALATHSIVFGDDVWRLVPKNLLMPAVRELASIKKTFTAELDAFLKIAPALIAQEASARPSLAPHLPTVDELRDAYSLVLMYRAVDSADFSMLDGELAPLGASMSKIAAQRVVASYEEGLAELRQRLAAELTNFIVKMRAYDGRVTRMGNGAKASRLGAFRDTTVTHLQGMTRLFNACEGSTADADALLPLTADALRADGQLRASATTSAIGLLEHIGYSAPEELSDAA